MEVTITVDVLRRAGIEVTLASLEPAADVTCSRGLRLVPDVALDDVPRETRFEALILPGGLGGAERLAASVAVGDRLRAQLAAGGVIGAICAAPTALLAHSIGLGQTITSHPSVRDTLLGHYDYRDDAVVTSGPFVTSQGPGTSFAFALELVRHLCGEAQAAQVRAPLRLA
jgi:protein DJ-1